MINYFSSQTKSNPLWLALAGLLGIGITASLVIEPLMLVGAVAVCFGLWLAYRIMRDPFFGVLVIAFFLPFERVGGVDAGGLNVRVHQVLALITFVSWIGQKIVRGKIRFRFNPTFWPFFVFTLINILSLVNAINLRRGALVLGFTLFVMIASFMVAEIVDSKEKIVKVARVLILSAFLVSLFGIFQWVGDMIGLPASVTMIRMGWYDKGVVGISRLHSTALEPLYFCNYLLVMFPLTIALILGTGKRSFDYAQDRKAKGLGLMAKSERRKAESLKQKVQSLKFKVESEKRAEIFPLWMLLGFALTMGLALLLTMSRGGYLAVAFAVFVLLIFRLRRFFTRRVVVLGLIAVGAVLGVFVVLSAGQSELSADWIVSRVTSFGETRADMERLETYSDAWNAFETSPWLGFGPGNFGAYENGLDQGAPDNGWGIVNNEYLELLAETGLFGFLSLAIALGIWIMRNLQGQRVARDDCTKIFLIASLASLAGFALQFLTFSTLYIMHIWFAIGFGVAVQNVVLEKKGFNISQARRSALFGSNP